MKRKNAMYFFGVMAALVVGYVAWAARIFYVRPDVKFDWDIAPDGRIEVAKWMDAHPGFFRFPFDWDRFAGELCDPYRHSLPPVIVTHHYYSNSSEAPALYVYRKGHRKVIRFWGAGKSWLKPAIY